MPPVSTPLTAASRSANIARREHKPELDGIRGLAILAVLLTHCVGLFPLFEDRWIWSKWFIPLEFGWGGVDLFFTLSGFLITGILLKTRASPEYFRSFYARRVLRIFPLYYGVLIVLFTIGSLANISGRLIPVGAWDRFVYFLYFQNFPTFHGQGNFVGHFWSLAVEEQFYLVWPLLVWRLSERTLLWMCGAGIAAGILFRVYLTHIHGDTFANVTFTLSRIDGLLVGAGCALFLKYREIPSHWIAGAIVTGMALVAVVLLGDRHDIRVLGKNSQVFAVFGFALLSGALIALSQKRGPLQKALSVRLLREFGKYSYGLYVYHLPIFLIAEHLTFRWLPLPLPQAMAYSLGLIVVSYLVAKISFDLFESKLLRLKRYFPAEHVNTGSASSN